LIYVKVVWHHDVDEPTDPIEIWYEIKQDQWALRGFEVFYDGKICKLHSMSLSVQIPTIEALESIKDFDGYIISKQEFEEMWEKAIECELGY
jgi:hypothetical protein